MKLKKQPDKTRGGDKPFPWLCGSCLKDEVRPATMRYGADVKHDGRMHHLTISKMVVPKCGACGELVFSNNTENQIRQALRVHLVLLTPLEIKEGRRELGLKKIALAKRLGVAAETISRWESGALIQSRAMDNLLRVYFAVPEARAVLLGADQDPKLGAAVVASST